ncbi:NAD(P)H-dependent glycerol-3-phosphate dehydrogenase [Telmatospirillum sp. J64-1]|uniref:NAD(P)H-dependent glycerol-3-phosphate dehydrogenase n=1 Tax=Telmatospirillum sp. J64-1 TaxID=2502183 RepID=UPI00115DD6B8|nr:NAD(P)H-dependent glycerol-3-phosphate dehydrogenase [Telmatospirillum sp. J64-1]
MERIGVIGAGAWGTALAASAARAGRQVVLWAREQAVADSINADHRNPHYLPDQHLPENLVATCDAARALDADAVLLVVPSQFLRGICDTFRPLWRGGLPAVICAKGIEQQTHLLMSEAVAEALPQAPLAILSGPTFAAEVARDLPSAVTLACADLDLGGRLVEALGTTTFRPYLSDDVIGAQMGGAVKNVLAIASGIVEGRGLGDNARAALVTRGLAEITRLAVAKGARPETLMGLSGLGDLILTANSQQSRNYSLGYQLGQGRSLDDILNERRSVTEGVYTASSVLGLAARLGVEMPICAAVNAVLHQGADLGETIAALLSRPFKQEC